jgi:hypothetical protein
MATNFRGWGADRINKHLDMLERAAFGGRLAELPTVPRQRSEHEWAILARREGAQAAAALRAAEEASR